MRLARHALALGLFAAFMWSGQGAMAQDGERRLIVSEGADYFGGDYSTIRDVTQADCEAACLADGRCQALTYNVRAGWCFLKENVGALSSAEGAVAARIVLAPRADEETLDDRLAALDFLPEGLRDEARRLRLEIAGERRDGDLRDLSDAELIARGFDAGGYATRALYYREALRRDPANGDAWSGLAAAARSETPDDYQERREIEALRQRAGVNAAATAASEVDEADALAGLAEAFEMSNNWPLAIRAYRASLAAAPSDVVALRLDSLVAQYGFRITENTVDNNAANPRICLTFSEPLSRALTEGDAVGDFVTVEGGETLPVSASGSQICVDGAAHGQRYRILTRPGITSATGEVLDRPVETIAYVRDRDPTVRFATHAYVLPVGGTTERPATIPVTTINTDRIEARVQRVPDRALARLMADDSFLTGFETWTVDELSETDGTDVWSGSVDVARRTNAEVVTAIPVSEIVPALEPGVYVLTAQAENAGTDAYQLATQWFVVTEIGLTTFDAADGFHVLARSLADARPWRTSRWSSSR